MYMQCTITHTQYDPTHQLPAAEAHTLSHIVAPSSHLRLVLYNDKIEKQIFLIFKEILCGAVAKSCMMKGFLKVIYEEKAQIFPHI
jgi:hypothetical protein